MTRLRRLNNALIRIPRGRKSRTSQRASTGDTAIITGEKLDDWIAEIERRLEGFEQKFERAFGYPSGENFVSKNEQTLTSESQRKLPQGLEVFYSKIDEISMPDVENGLFVHPIRVAVAGERAGYPTRVTGAINGEITVFGSDGGGGLFVYFTSSDCIYRLRGGMLAGATYDVSDGGVELLSRTLWGFLEFISDTLIAAISDMSK
ncbi:hypothetical protein [Streptomyces litchfieldiae]|uniref:Knr4/Smi1-like domain-containing protein n=1 Tax=Streptomyces litchfieldiae TaxID=3075543 RepID=A0ABU2MXD9_9ACTN|nr:hypothetical protein [Streptomyces sp. DSM 44938]MDT0346327.1 hypothetical protein [Streptomyces sp. DSM 44938]